MADFAVWAENTFKPGDNIVASTFNEQFHNFSLASTALANTYGFKSTTSLEDAVKQLKKPSFSAVTTGALTVNGGATISDTLTVQKAATLNQSLIVGSNSTVNGTLLVNGIGSTSWSADIRGQVNVGRTEDYTLLKPETHGSISCSDDITATTIQARQSVVVNNGSSSTQITHDTVSTDKLKLGGTTITNDDYWKIAAPRSFVAYRYDANLVNSYVTNQFDIGVYLCELFILYLDKSYIGYGILKVADLRSTTQFISSPIYVPVTSSVWETCYIRAKHIGSAKCEIDGVFRANGGYDTALENGHGTSYRVDLTRLAGVVAG